MTATASILTTEILRRPDGVAVRASNSAKEYENWFVAKDTFDEVLILWLDSVRDKEYKLESTRSAFRLEVASDSDRTLTRYIEVQIVLNV